MIDESKVKYKKIGKTDAMLVIVCILMFVFGMMIKPSKIETKVEERPVEVEVIKEVDKIVEIERVVDPYELTQDMQILADYIKKRKTALPYEMCRIIAYEVITQSKENHVPYELIVGMIEIESMWNPLATSSEKAKGLMQILREDGVEIDPVKAYNIAYNIEKGIAILKSKLSKTDGNLSLALNHYVGGDKEYKDHVYKYMGMFVLHKVDYMNDKDKLVYFETKREAYASN